jgi:hypothetical protein
MSVQYVVAMGSTVQRKNYRIDTVKLRRARRALGTRTETETIHRALELAADEASMARALERLLRLGPGAIEPIDEQ